jgi:ubiquinone/menaquinone biosynthesis C-methylase UbiE
MNKSVWIDLQDAVESQLELQVQLSFERHHDFMVQFGLGGCRRVVDLGTGNGLFLNRVAATHPDISFQGVDNNQNMISAAKARCCANVRWVEADALDSVTRALLQDADGILLRYFLLHLPRTATSLAEMLGVVRPGTRLWVFDLDTDHSHCEPPVAAFDEFRALVQEFCSAHQAEIRTSTTLPPILERLEFEVDAVAVEPFNTGKIDRFLFAEYLYREAELYYYCLHGITGDNELRNLKHFFEFDMAANKHFVQYGMVMISAVKRSI